jgi:hypothetical protein
MKKINLFPVLAITFIAALTSCKKDELQKEPLSAGTAMVSGRLIANLDETDFQTQSAPTGTGVTFIIKGEDLDRNPDTTYEYEDVIVRGTADADGNYSVSLPAVKKSITATVVFDEFEFDATVLTTNDDGFQEAVIVRRTFSLPTVTTVSIIEGQVLVKDYNYFTGVGSFVPSAMIRGVVEATLIDNVGLPTGIALDAAGTNYDPGSGNDINVTGGTGSGMTVNYSANGSGQVTSVSINNPGDGYTIGDVLTIDEHGRDATFEITAVTSNEESVPEGVLLTFTVGGTPYKVVTNASGEYLVKLPLGSGTASVQGADFETASVFFDNGNYVTGDKVYTFIAVANPSLVEGSIIELDLAYLRK